MQCNTYGPWTKTIFHCRLWKKHSIKIVDLGKKSKASKNEVVEVGKVEQERTVGKGEQESVGKVDEQETKQEASIEGGETTPTLTKNETNSAGHCCSRKILFSGDCSPGRDEIRIAPSLSKWSSNQTRRPCTTPGLVATAITLCAQSVGNSPSPSNGKSAKIWGSLNCSRTSQIEFVNLKN